VEEKCKNKEEYFIIQILEEEENQMIKQE